MPGRSKMLSRLTLRIIVVCAVSLSSGVAARGQVDVLPSSGMDGLNAEYRKHKDMAAELIRGFRVANSREISHVDALDAQAKYVTYRFTWPPLQQTPGEIGKVYLYGVDNDVRYLLKGKPGTVAAIEIYAAKVAEHALEVLKTNRLIARVNAARALARLADLGPPELADALVSVLTDPDQGDAVKFHAIHGLRVLAEQQPPVMSGEREKKAADALAAFINRNMTIADITRPEDVAGFRYVRREAVRALAQFRNPAVAANGQAGITLLRMMAKDGFVPSPRIDERVEAAIGVARYRPILDKEYNPDYAIAQIGLFLEEFNRGATAARNQRVDEKLPPPFSWRVLASRLCDAIDVMRGDVTDDAYAVSLVTPCYKLLANLEKDNNADPEEILRVISTTPPPSGRLYKNIPDSTVKPPNRPEAAIEAPAAAAYRDLKSLPHTPSPEGEGKPGAPPAPPTKPDANPFAPAAKPDAKPAAAPADAPPATKPAPGKQ
jgi:hypothetical protein